MEGDWKVIRGKVDGGGSVKVGGNVWIYKDLCATEEDILLASCGRNIHNPSSSFFSTSLSQLTENCFFSCFSNSFHLVLHNNTAL